MAINFPSIVAQLITPDLVARLAQALGLNPALVQTLVNAAIPAVLGALSNVAATPAGAKSLSEAISNQDPNLFANIIAANASGNHAAALSSGSNLLSSVLGGQTASRLAAALGKFTGANLQAASSILGLVGSAVIGAISTQGLESSSDGAAIAKLLAEEKNTIANAMPLGLGALLGGAGAAMSSASSAAASAASSITSSTNHSASDAAGGIPSWIYIAAALVVVAILAWFLLARPKHEAAITPATRTAQPATSLAVEAT